MYHHLKLDHFPHENVNQKIHTSYFFLLMAEHTAPIIRRTDVDLRKAVSKAH